MNMVLGYVLRLGLFLVVQRLVGNVLVSALVTFALVFVFRNVEIVKK